ncbi:MAG: U32 family peptidase [Firmicutes bacterium]|nr:U32 family peptidase [Bacillota bacterium]
MSRFFKNKQVELLAPAGRFDIFEKIIGSGADAVYFGGKRFNMRMHRKDYNFTDDEIKQAVAVAHAADKKVYITVNNLLNPQDIKEAKEFLLFLEEVAPDALMIQDFGIFELVKDLKLNLNLHASVMMNVHNAETLNVLKALGVTRIVASRDMTLSTVKRLHEQTGMAFEYFIHGDMCIAHGAQCLYSGMLFGKSSNRGLCMKPCRWHFDIKKDGFRYPTTYPMAVKDMYMYEHLPEMIEAGIVSFKIEGRMRDEDYLMSLISAYSDAINRYIHDPINYDRQKGAQRIYSNRKRDLSTGYAFGKPGLQNINSRYEGTGRFYSHGKVFSKPVEEKALSEIRVNEIKKALIPAPSLPGKPALSVKVNAYEQAAIALEEGVDAIYLSGDVFEPDPPFSKKTILDATKHKQDSKIYIAFPRMMYEEDFLQYDRLLGDNDLGLDGLVVTNPGAVNRYKDLGLELIGDYCLNIYNPKAAHFYRKQGLSMAALSVEAPLSDAKETIVASPLPMELIVHGSPVVMYLEHDLYENIAVLEPVGKKDTPHVRSDILFLVDEKGFEHPVYRDHKGRNHLTLYKELCYLPFLKELHGIGVCSFRIEGSHYPLGALRHILGIYKKAVDDLTACQTLFPLLKPMQAGFTLGAFQFD